MVPDLAVAVARYSDVLGIRFTEPTTFKVLRYDMGRKAALYASFGVRDLWVIDAVKLVTHVFRTPSATGYRSVREVAADKRIAPLVAPKTFALRLADLGID